MEEVLEDVAVSKRLRWAGHVARMDVCRQPKTLLFGWLPQKRPAHGTKQRWRDKSEERSEATWNREEQLVQGSTGQGTLESNVQGRPRYMH